METFTVTDLSFSYPGQERKALEHISFEAPAGQFITLCGPSGCGKTTLLRHFKPVLAPHGQRQGKICLAGRELTELTPREQTARIGFVLQSPENQIVTDKVWHELAFGLESLGYDTATIRARVAEMAAFFGVESWFYKDVNQLSGGQKQLLNLASIMALQPEVLLLDEPTSQLDPIAAGEFLAMVGRISRELGVSVILSEHRLEEAFPLSDRAIVLDRGRIIADGAPWQVGEGLRRSGHAMFTAMPAPMRIWARVDNDFPCPVTVREGRGWLAEQAKLRPLLPLPQPLAATAERAELTAPAPSFAIQGEEDIVLSLKDLWFRYDKNAPDVVKGLCLELRQGSITAILGGNGTGKSTALSLIAGLQRPYRGQVERRVAVGLLPQNPQAIFVKNTLAADLAEALADSKPDPGELRRRIAHVVRLCRLEALLQRHPYDLSGGEQQRAALAKLLLRQPRLLLLDEPTKGLDADFKRLLAQILLTLKRSGVTMLLVSHDVEFCAEYTDSCALFFDGKIVSSGPPRHFFAGNSFYTTAANRMARQLLPQAVTVGDVITACGGTPPPPPSLPLEEEEAGNWDDPDNWDENHDPGGFASPKRAGSDPPGPGGTPGDLPPRQKQRLSQRTRLSLLLILLAIPLTLLAGIYFFDDRKYFFISMLILLETMLPFALVFEGRRPQARELVVIAVLCGLGVVGRAALFMLPQFKPVTAIVIIAGVAMGGEAGFLVGALTMLVSNMLFSQGPWTPWQMFAMGIIGFLAGVLFRKGWLSRRRLPLCSFGAAATVLIYGGIMNPASGLMWQPDLNWKMLLTYYVTGLPSDLVHAAGTAVFLWLLAEPLLSKLDRIKAKYGLLE